MDHKITKRRLNDHLSYDWIKYIAIVLAAILLWSLILTMSAPRLPNNMSFSMFVMTQFTNSETLSKLQDDVEEILTDTAKSVTIQHWSPKDSTTASLVQTRFSTQEGDLMIVDNIQKKPTDKEDESQKSSFNSFADDSGDNYSLVYPLEDFINEALSADFLTVNEQEFRERIKRERKFNKLDTEEQILAGMEKEKLWKKDIQSAAYKLAGYLGMSNGQPGIAVENLAYRYRQYEQIAESEESLKDKIGEEKIWGMNVGYVGGKAVLSKMAEFFGLGAEEEEIKEYALGVLFKKVNEPYCYAYIHVLNYIVEKFKAVS